MRLIDANKIEWEYKCISKEEIDEMPTIEAIPIKWIINYASHKASKDLIDCYWHFWENDIYEMIKEWMKVEERKKENAGS